MASFSTKTRAIILSTLLICNKYSAIGDKITFFEPVYANDTNAKILPKEKIIELKAPLKSLKGLGLTTKETITPHEFDQAKPELDRMMEVATAYIQNEHMQKVKEQLIKKCIKDKKSRADLESGIEKTIEKLEKLEKNNKKIDTQDAKSLYLKAGRLKQKLERKSKGNHESNTSTLASIDSHASNSRTADDDFLHTADLSTTAQDPREVSTNANAPGVAGISTPNSSRRSSIASPNVNDAASTQASNLPIPPTNTETPSSIQTISPDEQQNSDQHAQAVSTQASNPPTPPTNTEDHRLSPIQPISLDEQQNSDQHAQAVPEEHISETPNVDATAPQAIEPQEVSTQAELQEAEPDLLNERDNNDNGNISSSEANNEEEQADNNAPPAASTIASSNYSDNQTQSSDSDIQSTTEDDTESDINNDDFITASRPVPNNNTAMIHDTDDNNHGRFTPILHSTIYKARTLVFPQISRKVSGDRTPQRAIGASCSSNLKILKRYELEAKYLYSTTTTPKTNGSSKSNIHGLLINLKRQMTSKFTAGVFYSPTTTNTKSLNNNNNNNNTSGCMDHLFGVYTSYAITPVTYLSNQIALGITASDNNKSSNEKYHNYLIFDSFISHKINIDATKIISPELGISYYQSNTHIPSDIGEIKNLSLNMGIKLQYKYKYNDFDFCPSIKINHVHPLYANITGDIKNLSNGAHTPSTDLLRDLQSAFDPHSSIRFALSIRHKSVRLEGGYGFTTYHNIEHSYAHTFFAKLNLSL